MLRHPISKERRISFGPCDHLNPKLGYQIRIQDGRTGETLLDTTKHPITDKNLTLTTCIEVANYYVPKQ